MMLRETAYAYIAKYLLGTIDLQEEHLLRHWVDAAPENSDIFEACFAAWDALEESGVGYTPDAEAAFKSFAALHAPQPVSNQSTRAPFKLKTWMWMLPLVLVLAGGGFWVGANAKPDFTTASWEGGQWMLEMEDGTRTQIDTLTILSVLHVEAQSEQAIFEYSLENEHLILRGIKGECIIHANPEIFILAPGIRLEKENGHWTKNRD